MNNELLLLNRELDELPGKVRFDEAHDGEKLMSVELREETVPRRHQSLHLQAERRDVPDAVEIL